MSQFNTIRVISDKEARLLKINRHVLEQTRDLIAVIGTDYIYQYVNPAYLKIHNQKADVFVGRHVKEFLGEEIFDTIIKPNAEKAMRGEDVRYETWFDLGEMGVYYMDVWYHPLHDSTGEVDRIAIITRDITPLKEAELERTYEEKLKTVVHLAATYNEEINNPLTSIQGYLEMMKRDEEDAKKIEYLDKALDNVKRISQVTRKIAETTAVEVKKNPHRKKKILEDSKKEKKWMKK